MKIIKVCLLGLLFIGIVSCSDQERKDDKLEVQEGYIRLANGKIWYKVFGSGEQTPLMALHGGPGGTHRYFYHLSPQAKDRKIILFDQLGTGRSTHHKDTTLLTVEQFIGQVRAVQQHLELDEFHLLGQSWGGSLALAYYLKYPDEVKSLALTSPLISTAEWRKDAEILISRLPDSLQQIIYESEESGDFDNEAYQAVNSYYWSKHGLTTSKKSHPMDTVEAEGNFFIYNYMWGPSEFTVTGTLKTFDLSNRLNEISVPTLFMTGEYDEARPETIKMFSREVEQSTVKVIENSGHSTLNDNGEAYNAYLKKFLTTVDTE